MHNIETTRLLLKKPEKEDANKLINLYRNQKVRQFLGWVVGDHLIEEKIAEIHSHWHKNKFGLNVVCLKSDLSVIGLCGLHKTPDGIEISYMFFPKWWGKGLASEAVSACLNQGFNNLNFEKIIAITQIKNKNSCTLLERLGMKKTTEFSRFGAMQSLYQIFKHEFQKEDFCLRNNKYLTEDIGEMS